MGNTATLEPLPGQKTEDDVGRPVYLDPNRVPRDLRTAAELSRGGYKALGPVVAWLELLPSDLAYPVNAVRSGAGSTCPEA